MKRFAYALAVVILGSSMLLPKADAQSTDCGGLSIGCIADGGDGTIEAGTDGSDDSPEVTRIGLPAPEPSDPCSEGRFAGLPRCRQEAADTGPGGTGGGAPCAEFEADGVTPLVCLPGVPGPPPRPVFTPPSIGEAAQRAKDAVAWPTINAGPSLTGGLDWILAGHVYSLHLEGYESWTPLVASVTITQTIVVQGFIFTEDFTATLTAVPREAIWDTGPTNHPSNFRHNPPVKLSCDNPGAFKHWGDGSFQDWQTYRGYGGPSCEYVFWGTTSVEGSGALSTISAEVVWDLSLVTSWAGDVGPVGEHRETYSTSGWEIDMFSSVGVLRNSEESYTHIWGESE